MYTWPAARSPHISFADTSSPFRPPKPSGRKRHMHAVTIAVIILSRPWARARPQLGQCAGIFHTPCPSPAQQQQQFFLPRPVVRAPHGRAEGVRMSKRRGGRGDSANTTRWASKSGNVGPLGTRQARRNSSRGRGGGDGDGAEENGGTRRRTRSSSSTSSIYCTCLSAQKSFRHLYTTNNQ